MTDPAPTLVAPETAVSAWRRELTESIARSARDRGRQHQERGSVELTEVSETSVQARVDGPMVSHVSLALDASGPSYDCSCSYHQDTGRPCQHLWATLLAVESQLRQPEKPLRESLPAWREAFQNIGLPRPSDDPPSGWREGRQLLYVVDLPATLARQGLAISVLRRDPRKDGRLGVPRRLRLQRGELERVPEPRDREILALLEGAERSHPNGRTTNQEILGLFEVPGPLHELLLERLASTGRCQVRGRGGQLSRRPLVWDADPWHFVARLEAGDDDRLALHGYLRRDGDEIGLDEPEVILASGVVLFENTAARCDFEASFSWVTELRSRGGIEIEPSDVESLMKILATLPELPSLDLPAEFELQPTRLSPTPILELELGDRHAHPWVDARLSYRYGNLTIHPTDPRSSLLDLARHQRIERDPEGEAAFEALLPPPTTTRGRYQLSRPELGKQLARLAEAGARVRSSGAEVIVPRRLELAVRSSLDWFELQGRLDTGAGEVDLPEVLLALRQGRSWVADDQGRRILLEDGIVEPLRDLQTLVPGRDLRFHRGQARLLQALLDARTEISWDDRFSELLRSLDQAQSPEPMPAPEGFEGELRDYQRVGLGWLAWLRRHGFGGCLADDMGLGKTVQVLALIAGTERKKPSLIVVPRSVVFNWRDEAHRFTPQLTVHLHLGPNRWANPFDDDVDLVLTTYGTLRRDILRLQQRRFDLCVLDEAQAIKNPRTATARAARLLDARQRLALSGTPIENHLGDLWSLFAFLNPGLLGSQRRFLRAVQKDGGALRDAISSALSPFVLRRTKGSVAKELPPRTEQTLICPLEGEHRREYAELRQYYRHQLLESRRTPGSIPVLEALLRLRQLACHPALLDPARAQESSSKFDVLFDRLEEVLAEGHKALVFSQFTSLLALLRPRIEARDWPYEYLDGQTRDRGARVEHFQTDPDCKLFLISLRAGGLGLNLTAADYVFLLDPWWNPAVEAQAIDRAHRLGQTAQVFSYRLITEGTVEEKVLELQRTKRELASIFDTHGTPTSLDPDDLALLLS